VALLRERIEKKRAVLIEMSYQGRNGVRA